MIPTAMSPAKNATMMISQPTISSNTAIKTMPNWVNTITAGVSWFMLAYTLGMSAYCVYVDYCNTHGYTPVTEVQFNTNSSISSGNNMGGGAAYTGFRDPSADFVNGAKLDKHYAKHGISMGFSDKTSYAEAASDFLTSTSTKNILSFTSSDGIYFRFNTITNEFGIINKYGGISTYFKPDEGINYWIDQVNKYSP